MRLYQRLNCFFGHCLFRADFRARKARFTAESGRGWRGIRVESLGTSERRRRLETVAGGATKQRQDRGEAKVVHHHAIDGAEPATHCPTQRGKSSKSVLYRNVALYIAPSFLFDQARYDVTANRFSEYGGSDFLLLSLRRRIGSPTVFHQGKVGGLIPALTRDDHVNEQLLAFNRRASSSLQTLHYIRATVGFFLPLSPATSVVVFKSSRRGDRQLFTYSNEKWFVLFCFVLECARRWKMRSNWVPSCKACVINSVWGNLVSKITSAIWKSWGKR